MAMVVNTNVQALNANRNLGIVSDKSSKASEKLSSGLRINRAADDAAGLAISEKMRSQIRGLDQASANAQDGISLLQTAEGALQETEDILQRMRELAVNAANDTMTEDDRDKVALELNELSKEIDGIAEKTEFNTKKLIDGSQASKGVFLQTGANNLQGMSFNISAMNASYLGVTQKGVGDLVTLDSSKLVSQSDATTSNYDLNLNGVTAKQSGTYHFTNGDVTINVDGSIKIEGSFSLSYTNDAGDSLSKTVVAGTFASYDDFVKAYASDQPKNGTTLTFTDTQSGSAFTINTSNGDFKITNLGTTGSDPATTTAVSYSTGDNVGTTNTWDLNGSKVIFTAVDGNANGNFSVDAASADYVGVTFTNADDLIITFGKDSANNEITNDELVNKIKSGQEVKLSELNTLEITYKDEGGIYQQLKLTTTIGTASAASSSVQAKSAITKGEVISSLTNTLDKAIAEVSSQRAKLGAYQNRLEHTIKNVDTSSENLTAAESRIRDTDMADEMMSYTQGNVMTQAATSMLAQANQSTQNALSLLG